MPDRRPVVGGNWKMHTDLAAASELADDVAAGLGDLGVRCDVAVFPPFPYLNVVGKALGHHPIMLGAQDLYPAPSGAFTGEVGLDMLEDLGVEIVLVGHSERRHVIGETDEIVRAKLAGALGAGLRAILCVGETLEQREAGDTDDVNRRQLTAALDGLDEAALGRVIIAYEPVWAIGTGRTASPEDAQAAHAAIRGVVAEAFGQNAADSIRIQYGGSVKRNNAADLFAGPDIDGGLIGGASLKADDFLDIIGAAASTAAPQQ